MEKQREKKLDLSGIDLRKIGSIAAIVIVVVLVVALCITINMRSHIQNEYTAAKNEIGEQMYTELYMLCQTFDQVTVPGQDVQNGVIPQMKDYYLAAQTLNTAMVNGFGDKYMVLTGEHISVLDAAFEGYDAAFRAGKSTDAAEGAMRSCMEMVRTLLDGRFKDGIIQAR